MYSSTPEFVGFFLMIPVFVELLISFMHCFTEFVVCVFLNHAELT